MACLLQAGKQQAEMGYTRSSLALGRVTTAMRVTKNNVLVLQDKPERMSGHIHLIQGKEEFPPTGTIQAVGPEVTEVAVGAHVVFQRKPASAIWPEAREGEEGWGLLVLPEDHILAVFE